MPTQKEIRAAIMDVLKRDVDRGNNGVLSQYRMSAESTRLLREEHISISGNSVLKDGEPLYRIRRRYSPHMVNGMHRELVPQLEAAEPSMEPERQRLYVDMDGTLTVFTPVDTNEQLYQEGFFRDAQAHENVVEAVKEIIQNHPEIEVYVLSAYLTDSEYALQEKNAWLDEHIPEIDPAHRIFVPNGSDKKEYVEGGLRNNDFLLDDYTKNLSQWEPPARGIKLLNAINHTRGTWEHDRIRYDRTPADLANGIVGIMRDEERVYDARVERNLPHEFTVHKSVLDGAWGGGLMQKYEALDEDGVVAGTLDFQTDRYGKPYVLYVETEQEYRRQGVATLLMQELQRDVFPQEIDFGLTTPEGTALLNAITEEWENPEGKAEREELESLRNLLSETQNRLDNLYQEEELDGITPETETEIAELGDRWQDTSYRIRQLEDALDEYGRESYRYVTLPEWKEERERPHGEESRTETLVREYHSLDGFSNDAIETEIDARDDTAIAELRNQDLERYGTRFLHAAMLVRENRLEDLQEFRDSLGGAGLTPWNMRHFNADRNILDLAIELSQGIQQNERRREMPTLDEYPLETLGMIAHIDDPEHINNNIAMSFYEGYSRTQGNPAISEGAEFFRRFQDGWSRANLKNAGRTGFYVFQRDLFDTGEYELVHVNTRNPVPDRDGMYSFGNGESLTDRQAAERIYQQLNTQAHPVDYYGTSPSVGDLIVLAESTLRPGEIAFSADDFRVMKVDRFGFSRANEELTPQMIAKMRNEMDVRQEIQLREELAHFAAEVGVDLPSERLSVLHREFDDPIRMSQQRLLDGVIERYDNDSRNFENGLIAVYQNPDVPGSADGIENVADDDFHVIFGIGDPYTPISGGHFSTLQEAQENVMRLRPAAQQIYERPVLFMPDNPGLQNYLDSHPGYKSIQFSDSVISQSNLTNMVYVYRDAMDFRIPSIIREAREQERTLESLQRPSEGTGEYIYRVEANPRPTHGTDDSFYIQAYRPLGSGQMEIGNVLYIGTFERCRELAEQLRVGEIQPEQLRDSYLRSLDVYRAEDFTLSDIRGIGTNGRGEPIAAIEFETVDGQRGMFHYNVQDTIRVSFFDRESGETKDLRGIMRNEEEFVSLSARIEERVLQEQAAVREQEANAQQEETTEQYAPISGEWQNGNIPVAIESTEDYETEGFRADRGLTDIDIQNPDGTWGREYAHERYRFVTYDLMSGRVHPLDARVFLNDRDIAVRDLETAVRENPRYVPLDYEALINRAADRAVLFRDTIRQAMEVAGYTVDPYSDTLTFYHEDGIGRMQFDDYVEAFEWLDGVVLDDLPAESQNRIGELVGSLKETAVEEGRMGNTMPEMDNGQYEPTPNRYTSLSDERLGDLSGTAEELFVMARNGYVENVEQLETIRDVLNNPVEQRADEARLVGFIIEREQNEQNPDIDTSAYNVGALKADFEQGINGGLDDVEIDEGMNLSLWRDGDNVIMSLHSFQEQEDGSILEGTGATSIPLDEFNSMTQQDFDVRMGTLYSMGMEFTEQEPEREQEQERMDYVVVTQSGGVRNDMVTFPTMEEAEQFMEHMGYEYRDENGFVWDMDVDTRPHEPTADILEEFSYGARDFGEGRIFRIYERGELPESDYPNQFWAVVEGGDLPGGRYEFEYDHHPTHDEVYGDFMDRYSAAALDLSEAALDRAEQENPLVENVPVVVERYVSTMNMQDGYEEPIAILREGNGSYSVQYNFDEDTGKGASATGQFATLEEARQDLLAHRTDAREEGREPGRMVVQAASMSCIPGYVVMSQFGRDDVSPSENVILGKAENYNNRGVYDNSDYSAIPVSENGKMHSFLSASAGWTVSQQHFLDNGTFTAADYTEYARLREELSARFPDFQTKMFEIDINREGSGVPFNPDWQNPNREQQERTYTAESVTDIVGKDSSYNHASRQTITTFDCKINGEPATLTFNQGQTETFRTPLYDRGEISDTFSIHTDGSVDLWDALDIGELEKLADRLVEEKDYFQLTRQANDAKTIEDVNDAAYAYTENENIRLTDEHRDAFHSTIENKAISISREMIANATPENINDVATQINDWISGFVISDENREMLLKEAQARSEEMEKGNTRDTQAAIPHGEDEEKLSAKDKLSQDLNEGVQKALNSENFKSWLDTSSKMFTNNYSFRNAILIWAQKPEASYCMGFEAWKDYGRTVAKGATAAKIFVPVIAYEKNEGGLFNMIKGNLTNQLKNDPTKPAVYRVGLSKIEITMNQQGLYGLRLNGKEQGIMNEQQMKRFIQNSVLNKVPMYFTTGNVFDVKDTAVPQFLWLKKGFTKDEMARDENGKPIKNKKGEYKIVNTPERQAKFNVNLEGEVKAQDPKKMAILLDALKSVSDRNGVPVTEKDKQDDEVLRGGAKGYFNRETNVITLDNNLEPTEKCAILLHEMGHADLHGDLEKLAREMGEKVPRSMREVQAEGVAYMAGRQMGLETNTASFSYIAAWSKGFEAQDLQKSLEVIYNESRKLMKEISAELDVRGLNLDLSEKPKEPLMQETKKELAAGYITRALAVESRNTDILTGVNETGAQYKNRMDVIAVLAQQQQLAQNQIGEAGNVKQLCESLMKSTDRTEQDGILAQLEAAKGRMDIGENRQNQLEQMFIGACAEKGANRRDEFVKNPEAVIAQLREAFPEKMAAIGAMQASYVCNSKYIRDNTARLLNTDKTGEKFVDEICNRAAAVDKVAAKNGCFVEVNFCEQWTDKPIVESGALCHPNVFNDIIKQGEVQVQKLKREAEKTGDYFPYNKCDISVFHPDKNSDVPKLTGTIQRIDIGDGGQKSFGDFIHQMAGEKSELSKVVDSAIRERGAKEKIAFNELAAAEPKAQEAVKNQPEQEAPEQAEDKTKSLEEWKKEIKDERGDSGNGHEAQEKTQDKAKGNKSHDRADG